MKNALLLLLVAGMLAACGAKPEAILESAVTGVDDGTKVYLHDSKQAKTDSTTVAGGRFRFEIAKAYPDQNSLQFEGKRGRIPFFVEPGAITGAVNFDGGAPTAVFTGTPTNDRLKAMKDGLDVFVERMKELEPELIALGAEGKGDGNPLYDSLFAIYIAAYEGGGEYQNNIARDEPNTILAAYLVHGGAHAQTTVAEMDSVLTMIAGAPANAFTDRLRERREVLARTAVGQPAPDFTQNMADGTPFSLSSLRGKLVLVDFWASWCGPCRAENPNVVKVYEKYHDRGFEIVGVSLDDSRENWLKAIEDDHLGWIHVSDLQGWSNAVAGQYAVRSIPHTVLVGTDGVILAKNLRGEELEAKIAEVLGTIK